MTRKTRFAALIALAAAGGGLSACGDDASRATATGTTATTATEPAETPEGVAAQYAVLEEEVAEEGGAAETGEWRIAYIKEPAEGWFQMDRGHLTWRDPARGETAHLEVIPIERSSGRIVPGASITLEVLDSHGELVEEKPLSFYHAEFFHYAENFSIPRDGEYTLRATVEPPRFRRFRNVMIDVDA